MSMLDFRNAANAMLRHLHARTGIGLWAIARIDEQNQVVLQALDMFSYGIGEGSAVNWPQPGLHTDDPAAAFRPSPVLLQNMRRGDLFPAPAPDDIRNQSIGAYLAVPVMKDDGTLFGMLVAMDTSPNPELVQRELPLIQLFADLLASLLDAELKLDDFQRAAERAELESLVDPLTGLYNRRAWDTLLQSEEARCLRYCDPATVLVLDLDGLKRVNDTLGHHVGDQLIQRATGVLLQSVRVEDTVARLGGDEFGVLAVGCNADDASALVGRLIANLESAGVRASIGHVTRLPATNLVSAWRDADMSMYRHKEHRRRSDAA